jgi:uncharacterized membrane protein YphA (DoxX/SURF4 family)
METTLKPKWNFQLSEKTKTILFDLTTFAFILLFAYTASSKILKFDSFVYVLSRMDVIGKYNTIIAYGVPPVELILCAFLLFPFSKRIALFGCLVLMIIFTLYLIYMVLSNHGNLPCSCGGVISKMSWRQHIWFNLFFIILAIFGLKSSK